MLEKMMQKGKLAHHYKVNLGDHWWALRGADQEMAGTRRRYQEQLLSLLLVVAKRCNQASHHLKGDGRTSRVEPSCTCCSRTRHWSRRLPWHWILKGRSGGGQEVAMDVLYFLKCSCSRLGTIVSRMSNAAVGCHCLVLKVSPASWWNASNVCEQ